MEVRRLLCFFYLGGIRIAEPHLVGVRDGTPHLLAYQIGGYDPQLVPRWLLVDLRVVARVETLDAGFFVQRSLPRARVLGWERVHGALEEHRLGPSVRRTRT